MNGWKGPKDIHYTHDLIEAIPSKLLKWVSENSFYDDRDIDPNHDTDQPNRIDSAEGSKRTWHWEK